MSAVSLKPSSENDSGVIDLGSMVSAYKRGDGEVPPDHIDLPLSAQVLPAPSVPPSRSNRSRVILYAGCGILLVAVTAFVTTTVVRSMAGPAPGLASSEPAADKSAATPSLVGESPAPPGAAAGADYRAALETTEAPAVAGDSERMVDPDLTATPPDAPTRTIGRDISETAARSKQPARAERASTAAPAAEPETAAKPEAAPEPAPPAVAEPKPTPAPTRKATASTTCDEVTCLVDPSGACCKSLGVATKTSSKPAAAVDEDLSETLTRADLNAGLRSHRGRIESCADRHQFSGTATVKLRVDANGRVTSAATTSGTPEFQSCLRSRIKTARFPKTKNGASLRYPFVFR